MPDQTRMISATQPPAWPNRCATFTHNWMKPYLLGLRSFVACLQQPLQEERLEEPKGPEVRIVSDEADALTFLATSFPDWGAGWAVTAGELIGDFEREMSPRALLHGRILGRRGPGNEWLGDLAHALWEARHPDRRIQLAAARRARADAEELHVRLQAEVRAARQDGAISLLRLQPLAALFEEFADRCRDLKAALDSLPRKVEVV